MGRERLPDLTESQREVLRLVFQHMTTSEIAWRLKIAEVSVNRRIDRARAVLGNISRKEAARLVAEDEGLTYEKIIPPPIILSDIHDPSDTAPSVGAADGRVEDQLALRLPFIGGTRDDLKGWQIICLCLIVGIVAIGSFTWFIKITYEVTLNEERH